MTVKLGVIVEFGEQKIPLRPKAAISEVKEKGIEVALPDGLRVDLGTLKSLVKGGENGLQELIKKFDSEFKLGTFPPPDVPAPFKKILEGLLDAHFSVEAFHIKLTPPRTGDSAAKTNWDKKYTIGLSLTWPTPPAAEGLPIHLEGIFLTVTNEGVAVGDPTQTAKQKKKKGESQ